MIHVDCDNLNTLLVGCNSKPPLARRRTCWPATSRALMQQCHVQPDIISCFTWLFREFAMCWIGEKPSQGTIGRTNISPPTKAWLKMSYVFLFPFWWDTLVISFLEGITIASEMCISQRCFSQFSERSTYFFRERVHTHLCKKEIIFKHTGIC